MNEIVYETCRMGRLEELPPRSIALDGAVQGPAFDLPRKVYSFDHHGGCIRHVTLATCEQVRDALLVGLKPDGFRIYLNDIDADSVVSTWLLLHPERLRGDEPDRLQNLVHRIGRTDALGPGVVPGHPLHPLLNPSLGEVSSRELLDAKLELLDAWWRGDQLATGAPDRPEAHSALWLERTEDGRPRVVQGEVEGGFIGLYRRSDVGIVWSDAPGGTRAYTVAKRSEFVEFDLPAFYARCNEIEPGWGGGSTVGGAPRRPDGSRSTLEPDQVADLLGDSLVGRGDGRASVPS